LYQSPPFVAQLAVGGATRAEFANAGARRIVCAFALAARTMSNAVTSNEEIFRPHLRGGAHREPQMVR
jgi:hypothetical protein